MAIEFIPLTPMGPDTGEFGNDGLSFSLNSVRYGQGSVPVYGQSGGSAVLSSTDVESDRIYGTHVLPNVTRTPTFIAGTKTKLFAGDNAAAYTDYTRAVGGAYATSLTSGYGWQFTNFGSKVIATNFIDDIQTGTGAAAFTKNNVITTPTTADPKARFVTTFKSHLVLGGFKLASPFGSLLAQDYPSSVWISVVDDETRFGSPVDTPTLAGTEFAHIYDNYGNITGLVGGQRLIIFKERAIYAIDGPPYERTLISAGTGCQYPNSIVKYFDDIYFWGDNGPCVLFPSGEIKQLGRGSWSRLVNSSDLWTYTKPLYPSSNGMMDIYHSAAVDYKYGTVYFSYPVGPSPLNVTVSNVNHTPVPYVPGEMKTIAIDIETNEASFVNLNVPTATSTSGVAGMFLKSLPYPNAYYARPMERLSYTIFSYTNDAYPITGAWRITDASVGETSLWGTDFFSPQFETKFLRPENLGEEAAFKIQRIKLIYSPKLDVGSITYAPSDTQTAPRVTFTIKGTNASMLNSGTTYTSATGDSSVSLSTDGWILVEGDSFSKYKSFLAKIFDKTYVAAVHGIEYQYEVGRIS